MTGEPGDVAVPVDIVDTVGADHCALPASTFVVKAGLARRRTYHVLCSTSFTLALIVTILTPVLNHPEHVAPLVLRSGSLEGWT